MARKTRRTTRTRARSGPPALSPEAKAIIDQVLGMQLYVILSVPVPGKNREGVLAEHLKHQVRLERRGIMFGAGPLQDRNAPAPNRGMIVIRAKSFAEAKRIADSDPFHKTGMRRYTLHRWTLNEGGLTFKVRYTGQTVRIS